MRKVEFKLLTPDDVREIVRPVVMAEVRKAFDYLEARRKRDDLFIITHGKPADDSMAVSELHLSCRTENGLNNAEIKTVGQLCKYTDTDLMKFRNFGRTALFEVQFRLAQVGRLLTPRRDAMS